MCLAAIEHRFPGRVRSRLNVRRSLLFIVQALGASLLASAASVAPASAAVTTSYYRPSGAAELVDVASGYRALFTCSAHFVAHRELADILRVELVDTRAFKLPAPVIDEQRRLVTAQGADGQVAIAAHRQSMGCTLLPPDWGIDAVIDLPHVELEPVPDMSGIGFPEGDRVSLRTTPSQDALLLRAFDGTSFGSGTVTGAVVVVRDGEMVAEGYGNGFEAHSGYRTWSTAKSISATLIAIAVRDGLMKLGSPAPVVQWQSPADPRRQITLVNLLHMSSGLDSGSNNSNAIYFGGAAVGSAVTRTELEAPPGTRWQYANNDTLLLLRALRHVLKSHHRYLRYPYDELFHRIGMYHTRMEIDHAGDFVGSSQVYSTARDLARFGLLYLNDGIWNGERILPKGWTHFVAQSAPKRAAVRGQPGYGAHFWLLDQLPGIPKGTYTTSGSKGQYVTVLPERNIVVVRTGVDPEGKRWDQPAFVKEVLEHF